MKKKNILTDISFFIPSFSLLLSCSHFFPSLPYFFLSLPTNFFLFASLIILYHECQEQKKSPYLLLLLLQLSFFLSYINFFSSLSLPTEFLIQISSPIFCHQQSILTSRKYHLTTLDSSQKIFSLSHSLSLSLRLPERKKVRESKRVK